MDDLLEKLTRCVEKGKVDSNATFPPDMKGEPGADELTMEAITLGFTADNILNNALLKGMQTVGVRFRELLR